MTFSAVILAGGQSRRMGRDKAWLLINGRLPTRAELDQFSARLTAHAPLHEGFKHHFEPAQIAAIAAYLKTISAPAP